VLAAFDDAVLTIEVVESKIRVPDVSATTVSRAPLVNRLRTTPFPVAVVVAPPGYGKTTLLAQWAAKDARPVAWLTLDERDNEPGVLLRHVAAVLNQIAPLSPAAAHAIQRTSGSIWDSAIPRLTAHLVAIQTAFVLVLDDADLLESEEGSQALESLISSMPTGSMVALGGRVQPRLPVAALRAQGRLLELGPEELALSRREAELLLKQHAVRLRENDLSELLGRTEGWAGGINLAALTMREATADEEGLQLAGDNRHFAEYFHAECLSGLAPELRGFLRRTAILEQLCGSLCDALLDETRSHKRLEEIEQANVFVFAHDARREWFRCHRLLRELLIRELEELEPERVLELHSRAAAWYEAHGDPESALHHACAAADGGAITRLLTSIAFDVHGPRRVAAVEDVLTQFDDAWLLERHPSIATLGSSAHAQAGRAEQADRWLRAAERGAAAKRKGAGVLPRWIASVRSTMCANGPAQMEADADSALARLPEEDPWRPATLLAKGVAATLLGETERAEPLFDQAAAESQRLGRTDTLVVATAERSLLAARFNRHAEAGAIALEAFDLIEEAELLDQPSSALAIALSARALLRRGQWERARQHLDLAERLVSTLTEAIPWFAMQVRFELGAAYVTLRDRDGATRSLEAARELLVIRPDLGTLVMDLRALGEAVEELPKEAGHAGLTRAELRILPLLATHLSFREMAVQVGVSRNTIKTHAVSMYRKFGVSNRSEAVARANDLGLIETEEIPEVFRLRPPRERASEPDSVAL
jgi:LuxR family maltose regulon positive regulatory protein